MGGMRIRNEAITLTCAICTDSFGHLKAGVLPKLCPSCAVTNRWCPACKQGKVVGEFYASQKPGSPCRSCSARTPLDLTCANCGLGFKRTNRGGGTSQANPQHLCDDCETVLKWCATCDVVKPTESFNASRGKRDGRCSACKECMKIAHAARSTDDRRAVVARRYGITTVEWDAMYLAQDGLCAACGQPPLPHSRGLVVDHNHATGQVRALLCAPCNIGLGHFADSAERLRLAAEYLDRMSVRGGERSGRV